MHLLGIDGGSTKMDFLVTDLQGNPIFEHRIYKGSNLKYVGADNVIANLEEGFMEIQKNDFQFEDIKFAYLGIAECGPKSGIPGRNEVMTFLEESFENFELTDDQFPVFYSNSSGKEGVLANAGTGSNINRFWNGEEKTYKSLGHGGRDFGKSILSQIYYEGVKKDSLVYQTVEEFFGQSPIDFYNSLEGGELVIHPLIIKLPRILREKSVEKPGIMDELDMMLIMIGDRWGSKITSYCYANFGYNPEDQFDIVMTGGVWNWEKIRKIAMDEVEKVFPNANIRYNPEVKPVVGCIKLAKERVEGLKLIKNS